MPTVGEIAAYLERRIPPSLKLDFDNVGLLCGFPDREVTRILVVLDVTLDAIEEAAGLGAELIVAHHPVIFTPMKSVLDDDPVGRRVIRLIQCGISAICMHTNLDRLEGGVNSALAAALGGEDLEMLDMGCVCRLPESMRMEDFLDMARGTLSAQDMRYYSSGRPVSRLALCGGAGGEILYEAAQLGCDTVLTGEIKHHQWIDGAELGLNLIEGGHFATENAVTPVLSEMLREAFPDVDVLLSCRQSGLSRGFSF